jgi:hypothetical protein
MMAAALFSRTCWNSHSWSVARRSRWAHLGSQTIRKYLKGEGARGRRRPAPSCLQPFLKYIAARYDPHLRATVLHGDLVEAGFERSYPTLVRKLRRLELRPVCLVCQQRGGRAPTVELEHPAGEEIQWDWLELPVTPWGQPAFLLVGALSHSGRFRAVGWQATPARPKGLASVACDPTPVYARTKRGIPMIKSEEKKRSAPVAGILQPAACPSRPASD